MARYSAFLGLPVEVHYRAGDICIPALGVFVADSGRSIFLKQHCEQRGQVHHFSWEIPYSCIVRVLQSETLSSVDEPEMAGASASTRKTQPAKAIRAAAGHSLR